MTWGADVNLRVEGGHCAALVVTSTTWLAPTNDVILDIQRLKMGFSIGSDLKSSHYTSEGSIRGFIATLDHYDPRSKLNASYQVSSFVRFFELYFIS